MKIHQRTGEEQRRIAEKSIKILSEDSDMVIGELATRFGMSSTQLISIMKKCGYQTRRKRKANENIIDSIGDGN